MMRMPKTQNVVDLVISEYKKTYMVIDYAN
jgi:hypothetical protein